MPLLDRRRQPRVGDPSLTARALASGEHEAVIEREDEAPDVKQDDTGARHGDAEYDAVDGGWARPAFAWLPQRCASPYYGGSGAAPGSG